METGLSLEEQEALAKFRRKVEDVLAPDHDDGFLLRWLRARDFKLKEAEAMLRKSLQWRKKGNIDSIQEWYRPTEVMQKYWPAGFIGYDKEGCPVLLVRFGNIDMRGIVYSTKKSEVCKYIVNLLETGLVMMESQSKKLGRTVDKLVVILDLDNFSFYQIAWTPAFRVMTSLVQLYEDHYPENLKHILAINTPAIFHAAFALLKPFFSERTYKKVILMRRDAWEPLVFNEIDKDQLPAFLGGSMTGPNEDVYCTHLVSAGGTIPHSYYAGECTLTNEKQATSINISPGSVHTVDILVKQPESILSWEFRTKSYTIAYGLFQKTEAELKEIIPIEKVNSDKFPESGSFYCRESGTYLLKFDNSFSWTKSKTVLYLITVTTMTKE